MAERKRTVTSKHLGVRAYRAGQRAKRAIRDLVSPSRSSQPAQADTTLPKAISRPDSTKRPSVYDLRKKDRKTLESLRKSARGER